VQIWEGITLAMNQLRSEKLKTFFSLLGVIMGVMFLIVVVTVIEASTNTFAKRSRRRCSASTP
jgi:putative ABC transport system permease protein